MLHTGLEKKDILWDDEDNNNKNSYSGQLPDGEYGKDTKIYFCCRSDGYATNDIILPTDSPFVLFKSNNHLCQLVRGMNAKNEYFYWDGEDKNPKSSVSAGGPYAQQEGANGDIRVHYCYYVKQE